MIKLHAITFFIFLEEKEIEEDVSLHLAVHRLDQTEVQQVLEGLRAVLQDALHGRVQTENVFGQTLGECKELPVLRA